MAESKVVAAHVAARPSSSSPPPNCAICLGTCTNKCFSDSCMHQFCFNCLLEWSKIKAECPLCKQAFKSIIHNVKSNEEYDEHVVETIRNEDIHIIDNEDFLYLPHILPQRHQFHFRTTFTVDTRWEHAIQQMLLTHPLTNGGQITIGSGPLARNIYNRRRRDFSSTAFRRSIYTTNLWVSSLPDSTGRYRDVSPQYFRNNPAARQRLVPWLNRELNALLFENTQLVMRLVDIILDHLPRHHICSRTFRNLLREYLDNKTDHFVHEFYNFMRSPYDMIGFDNNIVYTENPRSPAPYFDVSDDNDSDVILVDSEPLVIDLINTDSDEPILVCPDQENAQVPMPITVPRPLSPSGPSSSGQVVNLPAKLRHKQKRSEAVQEREKWKKLKRRYRCCRSRSRSSSSSSSSSDDERQKASSYYRKYKKMKMLRKIQKMRSKSLQISSSSSDSDVNITGEDEDNKPLIDIIKKKWRTKDKKDKKRKSRSDSHGHKTPTSSSKEHYRTKAPPKLEPIYDLPSCSRYSSDSVESSPMQPQPSTSSAVLDLVTPPSANGSVACCPRYYLNDSNNSGSSHVPSRNGPEANYLGSDDDPAAEYNLQHTVKSEVRAVPPKNSLILRKHGDRWRSYGGACDSDSSDD